MRKKLFIPGPVDVNSDVLEKMSGQMLGHRTEDVSRLQESISRKFQKLTYSQDTVLLSTSSGSGLMEGAVRSCTAKRACVFSIGAFGDRWYDMAVSNGVPADLISSELGQPTRADQVDEALATGKYDLICLTHNETATGVTNSLEEISQVMKKYPEVIWCVDAVSSLGGSKIEVDKLGIDVCITSTQKCLGLPPGMSLATVSEKAIENARKVEFRGSYFDYLRLYKFVKERKYQYPSTPSLSHMYALDYQLDRIFEEGLDKRFARHKQMAEMVREWAKENFALYSNEDYLSDTVTCISKPDTPDFSDLSRAMGERGYLISNGYGALRDKTFRIAHMADTTPEDIKELLLVMEQVLKDLGN